MIDDAGKNQIVCRFLGGETLQQIGESFGVSRERIRQILKACGVNAKDGGVRVRTAEKRERAQAEHLSKRLLVLGCTRAEFVALSGTRFVERCPLAKAFVCQSRSAMGRGEVWDLPFPEWLGVWQRSGQIANRGIGPGKWVMTRIDRNEYWMLGNVEIVSWTEACVNRRQYKSREKMAEVGPA